MKHFRSSEYSLPTRLRDLFNKPNFSVEKELDEFYESALFDF